MSAKNADLEPKMPDAGMMLIGRESLTVSRERVKQIYDTNKMIGILQPEVKSNTSMACTRRRSRTLRMMCSWSAYGGQTISLTWGQSKNGTRPLGTRYVFD